jgi:tellurite resistance protein
MEELYEGIHLTNAQAEWITRGMLDLAAVDGIHEAERALIADFYAGEGGTQDLDALAAKGFDPAACAEALKAGGEKVIEAFLTSCYLLIYADGSHSDKERERVSQYADAMGLSAAAQEDVHVKARLYVLRSLAHILWSKETVHEIGASMGLAEHHIAQALEK